MKRIILLLSMCVALLSSCRAQNPFQALSDMKNVETVYIGKALMKVAGSINLGTPSLNEIKNKVESVLVINIENKQAAKKAAELVEEYIKANELEMLLQANDGEDTTVIYSKPLDDGKLQDMLLFVNEPDETNIILITGSLSSDDLAKVASIK